MKKTLFFVYVLNGGGAEKMLANVSLYSELPITFVTHQAVVDEYQHKGNVINLAVDRYRNKYVRAAMTFIKTIKVLRAEQPEVVLTCLQYMNLMVLSSIRLLQIFGQLKNTHVVVRFASPSEVDNTGFITKVLRYLYQIPDAFVSPSNQLGLGLQAKYKFRLDRLTHIPNSLDLEYEYRALPSDFSGKFDVITIGRFVPVKDHKMLINAIARLRYESGHDAISCGIVSNGGEEEQALRDLVKEKKVAENISFLDGNNYDYAQALLKRAKVFVLTSKWEGFGTVIVEAMRAGLPIVSTNCPVGPPEVLDNGKYGIMVPVGDDAALAAELQGLLNDPIKMSRYKELSLQRVQAFNIRNLVKEYERVLLGQ